MYSGASPLLRTKFWKKEFVGRGVDSKFGEKNLEGSGRTVELPCGNRKGVLLLIVEDMVCDYDVEGLSGY
jgi:hypothetical protein